MLKSPPFQTALRYPPMLLHPKRLLAELVRILEEDGYIFAADPAQITDSLRDSDDGPEARLLRRAALIDRNGRLADALQRNRNGVFWLWVVAATLLFTSSFSATFVLMDEQGLNFFLVLAGALGLNSAMLLLWLAAVVFLRRTTVLPFSSPSTWLRGKDPVNQAMLRLYGGEWTKPAIRWRIGAAAHSLWLSTLAGVLVCVLLLLLVRQYTFNWESTLLNADALVKTMAALSWLPEKMGFAVPDAGAVASGRLNGSTADARAWAGLLIGSIVCYGILPRLAAWLACVWLLRRAESGLPLDAPYYRKIIEGWQRSIVDADDFQENIAAVGRKFVLNGDPKWAVMLETEWQDSGWYRSVLAQEWQDKGCADSRDAVAALTEALRQTPTQLLIGVRAHTVPDRGVLRQIAALAEAAQGGAVVQLLQDTAVHSGNLLPQWHDALDKRGIAWLNPPHIAQTGG